MERYNRQIILTDFGPKAQKMLQQAKVLVVGAGGLGVPVLTYLNAMGIGTLGIVDHDRINISNLHRQVLYDEADIGRYKVDIALRKLKAQNSETRLIPHKTFLSKDNALELISGYDIVVDASDNFPTRYLINDACVICKKPFVYGALHGFEGQISVFNHNHGPTYRCLFPTMPGAHEVPNCNEHGVLGSIPGIVGNLQALETVKVITGVGETVSGKLVLFNGLSHSFQKIAFSPLPKNKKRTILQENYDFECEGAVNTIDANAFEAVMKERSVQLIDVRSPEEFNGGHLERAKNIPLSQLEVCWSKIDFTKDVYVICQSGFRSTKAVEKLRAYQPNTTYITIVGGMNHITSYVGTH